ncbi:hypothetical protein PACTADRAFT_45790 [Pachysolen tannophilus NRRL Y-2460]|uniref:Peptidase M20 dimerisation domain-containing protein n=1 Tax=Pachysolen tannophilus NRRL Y-2460 TaxID=669874 RepID=A0A1E4TQ97_PACTA|nr:hypothetical protein PACTADRAFT_45790 [Pachysolen tannophilus NRRL Y-2460]
MSIQLPISEKRGIVNYCSSPDVNTKRIFLVLSLLVSTLVLIKTCSEQYYRNKWLYGHGTSRALLIDSVCPSFDYYRPSTYEVHKDTVIAKIIKDESFRKQSAAKLSGAVQVQTEVYDDAPQVDEDPEYWAKFEKFHSYLEKTFPIAHQILNKTTVNTYGLVYEWPGSDDSLKPLMLTAHQDVVPVQQETIDEWTYPPFEGHYDGKYLWGRGVSDCKNLLIGLLEAAEELIKVGFEPKRTIIFSFGFDEEVGGLRNKNANLLLKKYGVNSVYAVVDEGGISLTELEGTQMALPGTGEKGSVNAIIELTTPGGHSSIPPDHTSIGIMSALISEIENTPFEPFFTDANPTFMQYTCMAEHSTSIKKDLKKDILNAGNDKAANKRVCDFIDQTKALRYYIKSSQAIDIIKGGVKSNALPEHVEIIVNHRVAIEQRVDDILAKDIENIKKIAKFFKLGVYYQYKESKEIEIIPSTSFGFFKLIVDDVLEPAPITPIHDHHWEIFAGNIRHVYEEIAEPNFFKNNPIIVSPGIATGNTDTRLYWNLTNHIYRYRPGVTPTVLTNAHTINEHIDFNSHLQIIAFYFEYIQSVDETNDLD